jgi:hypothetical protein
MVLLCSGGVPCPSALTSAFACRLVWIMTRSECHRVHCGHSVDFCEIVLGPGAADAAGGAQSHEQHQGAPWMTAGFPLPDLRNADASLRSVHRQGRRQDRGSGQRRVIGATAGPISAHPTDNEERPLSPSIPRASRAGLTGPGSGSCHRDGGIDQPSMALPARVGGGGACGPSPSARHAGPALAAAEPSAER